MLQHLELERRGKRGGYREGMGDREEVRVWVPDAKRRKRVKKETWSTILNSEY